MHLQASGIEFSPLGALDENPHLALKVLLRKDLRILARVPSFNKLVVFLLKRPTSLWKRSKGS